LFNSAGKTPDSATNTGLGNAPGKPLEGRKRDEIGIQAAAEKDWMSEGRSYIAKEEWDNAIDAFTKAINVFAQAIDKQQKAAEAHFLRAKSYGKKGDNKRAIGDYEQADRLNHPGAKEALAKARELGQK
jgi:tetratricopeptide (TPR) repeat protein